VAYNLQFVEKGSVRGSGNIVIRKAMCYRSVAGSPTLPHSTCTVR